MIIIAAPHTSNWDLMYLLGAAFSLRLPVNWLGKSTLFRGPQGILLRALGGIPVDRSKSSRLVESLVADINERRHCAIVVSPPGTRAKTSHWKSGFYWIARDAGIPIVCGFLDYEKKVAGLGDAFVPTGDITADMNRIRRFYEHIAARYPEKKSVIRLREE